MPTFRMPATESSRERRRIQPATISGNVRVFRNRSTGTSDAGVVGDPHIYMLWPTPAQAGARTRGLHQRIDTSRYRILTTDLGVERTRDLNLGSIARIIWHVDGENRLNGTLAEIESSDIALRHLDPATQNGGKIVLDTIQMDMADRVSLPIESDYPQPGSGWKNACTPTPGTTTCNTSGSGYKPGVNLFRLDFHEFWQATDSYVRRIKLAALERTGSSFTITWTPSNPSSLASTVTLKAVPVANAAAGNYRPADPACSTASSITIATGVPLANGSYAWSPGSTAGVANGSEYLRVHANRGERHCRRRRDVAVADCRRYRLHRPETDTAARSVDASIHRRAQRASVPGVQLQDPARDGSLFSVRRRHSELDRECRERQWRRGVLADRVEDQWHRRRQFRCESQRGCVVSHVHRRCRLVGVHQVDIAGHGERSADHPGLRHDLRKRKRRWRMQWDRRRNGGPHRDDGYADAERERACGIGRRHGLGGR